MFKNVPQEGKHRPQEKEILSTGLVIIRTDIQEHTLTDQNNNVTFKYTWIESRYSTAEYLALVDQERDLIKTQLITTEERLAQTEDTVLSLVLGGM